MNLSLTVLLLAGLTAAPSEKPIEETHFDNYTQAYKTAKSLKKPLLVVINPAEDSDKSPIKMADIEKTKERRDLLKSYVVVVLDAGCEHGEKCCKLFGDPELPRVVVIDKEQKWQIFRTSQKMYGQLWTDILTTYKTGRKVEVTPVMPGFCPSCQRY